MSENNNSSKPSRSQAINLYGVYNEELTRMHALMQTYLQLPKDPHGGYGSINRGYQPHPSDHMPVIYQRIVELQNILIAALQSHDPLIQEKVAELALTGTDEVKSSNDEIPF